MRYKQILAIAAVAALFLFATSPARAALVAFDIDPTKSYQAVSQVIDATELAAGVYTTVPQFPDPDGAGPITGSDLTALSGCLFVDLIPGFIDIGAGGPLSTIDYAVNNTPGVGGVPGTYAPKDPPPVSPPLGSTPLANYGIKSTPAGLSLSQVQYDMRGYLANLGAVGYVPVDGFGDFPYAPGDDAIVGKKGRLAFWSALGTDTGDVIGDPLAAFGTAGVAPGNWSGGVLTLPIESSYTIALDTGDISPGTHVYVTFNASGVIVATPKVPEPSTMVLLGFGVVGLLACGWRLRKRRA